MKIQYVLFALGCFYLVNNIKIQCNEEPIDLSKKITSDVTDIASSLTKIVIACKDKDEKKSTVLKSSITDLIRSITSIVESAIEKRNQKKKKRSISIDGFQFFEIASNPLEAQIQTIADEIIISLEENLRM